MEIRGSLVLAAVALLLATCGRTDLDGPLGDAETGGGAGGGGSKAMTPPGTCGSLTFPSFSKSCDRDSDCAIAVHQVDCCGTEVVWGIHAQDLTAFVSAEAACAYSWGECGCDPGLTRAEDGNAVPSFDQVGVACFAGICGSFVVGR